MADPFSSELKEVAAPRGAQSFGRARAQRPQTVDSELGLALGLASTIFGGTIELLDKERSRGLRGKVANAISESLADLRKFKAASNQKGDGTQQFNIRLAAKAKELRVRGFDPDLINAAFRDEGFLPPKAALFNEAAEAELREEQA